MRGRGELDRFEVEQGAFFQRVRDAYHQRAASDADRYRLIDASQTLPEVQADLQAVLDNVKLFQD